MSHHIDGNEPSTQRDSFNRPYIPRGCDQQGRYPQAAEAETEIGAEPEPPDLNSARAVLVDVAIVATIMALIHAAVWLTIHG